MSLMYSKPTYRKVSFILLVCPDRDCILKQIHVKLNKINAVRRCQMNSPLDIHILQTYIIIQRSIKMYLRLK